MSKKLILVLATLCLLTFCIIRLQPLFTTDPLELESKVLPQIETTLTAEEWVRIQEIAAQEAAKPLSQRERNYFNQARSISKVMQIVREHFHEPFSQRDILDLEKKLASANDPEVRIYCAALLYRYGQQSGEAYLSKQFLTHGDVRAAEIFAMSQDEKYLSQLIGYLVDPTKQPADAIGMEMAYKGKLVVAMGNWNEEAIRIALLNLSQRVR